MSNIGNRSRIPSHSIIGAVCGHSSYVRSARSRDEERDFLEMLKEFVSAK